MGLISFLGKVISNKTKSTVNGNYICTKIEGFKDDILETEAYQIPGILSKLSKDTKCVVIPINGDKSHSVIVASHNYNLNIDVNQGGTLIYSTNTEGTQIKAKILVDNDGKIGMNNDSENLKSLIDSLIDGIIGIVTIGSPASHSLAPSSRATLNEVKSNFAKLLKDL